jgi:hypothetical protein
MDPKDLKKGFDKFISSETIIRRQKLTEKNMKKNMFCSMIKRYEDLLLKSNMIKIQYGLDLSSHEDPFFNLIDDLFLFSWDDNIYQLIQFYIYERIDLQSGEEQFIIAEDGSEIYIRTPEQLFDIINKLYPGII